MDGVRGKDAMKHFSTRDAARVLETSEDKVRFYARAGLVEPHHDDEGRLVFDFQDLLLLRTTKGLLDSGVPARHMRRIWASLRRQLAPDMPLTSIRIYADGRRAVAWDGRAKWRPDSGQFVFEFDGSEMALRASLPEAAGTIEGASRPLPMATAPAPKEVSGQSASVASSTSSLMESPASPNRGERELVDESLTASQWFHLACEIEASSPREAVQAYHQALEFDPDFADAHVNLGRHYHETRDLEKAEAHYREAIRCAPGDATSHFNLGVLLEDRERRADALTAYERALARDPELADAHYNLGLLCETLGRRAQAMRHLMLARRLYAAVEADA